MRTCLIGALAICLVGCSRQPPELALASCAGPNAPACFDRWGETEPSGPAAAAMDIRPSAAVKAVGAPSAQVRHRARPAAKAALTPAKADVAASRVNLVPEASKPRPQPGRTTMAAASPEPKAAKETSASSEPARQAVAAAVESSSPGNPDFLVAIVMAGPDIKSISDLTGRTIAIDDRYSASGSTVRTAIVAAGAPQVQLSEGQGTAMNRLSNGEVPAAVVALVTPEAAEKFPAFAAYRIFQVPLSPYSVKTPP